MTSQLSTKLLLHYVSNCFPKCTLNELKKCTIHMTMLHVLRVSLVIGIVREGVCDEADRM